MRAALLIVLSLSAVALAGPAFNKNANQIDIAQSDIITNTNNQHMTDVKGPAVELLKQWCFSSQMAPQTLTASFKKLVSVVKSSPIEQAVEAAVMGERICQGALVTKGDGAAAAVGQTSADAQAHELIKDVYMDALIACKSRDCTTQLVKIINSQKVEPIRAAYYMTRIAVTEKDSITDEAEIKQLAESFVQDQHKLQSESIERQKLFAATSLIGKWIQSKPSQAGAIKPVVEQVAKTIVERYIKPVSEQDIQQYQQQQQQQQTSTSANINEQLIKKIAKRSAALKALANIPGHVIAQCSDVTESLTAIIKNKAELVTARQSAIECLEQNEQALALLKEITFDQEEPTEVRVAAYRALMTVAYAGEQKSAAAKEQIAAEIVGQVVKHCEEARNQQEDDQFVLYAISHLDNVRTSQQPEHQAIKECIAKNKQHYMQIQVLCKKLKQQLADVRRSSRNYKLEQEFNQLESGLVIEGDLIYANTNTNTNTNKQQQQQKQQVLPKVIRVNVSMPVMGETVNVVELSLRQNNMDEELLGALSLVSSAKFNSQSMSKVVDSFKSSVEKQTINNNNNKQQQQHQAEPTEADLSIKVDGCTVVYLSADDFKTSTPTSAGNKRTTRSVYAAGASSIVDDVIEYLKRKPVAFNRGFNFNLNERLAKVLDVEANIIAGLRFESRAQGQSADNFEIVAQMEPRFSFEAIVGPAKVSSKKLLQRVSSKGALGLRLRFKKDELVDLQVELPMNRMELFTVESQLVEKSAPGLGGRSNQAAMYDTIDSYSYLPDSIYGPEDIYTASYPSSIDQFSSQFSSKINKIAKRSIFATSDKKAAKSTDFFGKLAKSFATTIETPEEVARATGLRAKLRVAGSPKDLSLLVAATCEKYEPEMKGFRVQVQKTARGQDQKSYQITLSTPGSRLDRTMQVRLVKQTSAQRTSVKSEIQSSQMSAALVCELVHDGRQYSAKTEIVSRSARSQWRHQAELGLTLSQQSARGIATQYKPYVSIESTSLPRPIQLLGTVSYQQAPKSVISYELKCPTYGDFVSGKLILEQRDSSPAGPASMQMRKRSAASFNSARRSMSSPVELLLKKDLTLTSELIGQVQQHAIKVHNMIDWNCDKLAVQFDHTAAYKNLRQPARDMSVVASMKFDDQQQVFTVERKCSPQKARDNFRFVLQSYLKSASAHEMLAELRYDNNKQQVAYKHQLDIQKVGANKYDCAVQLELVDTQHQVNEKIQGRARLHNERRMKSISCELAASGQKQLKVDFDFESVQQHQLVVVAKTAALEHKTELRADRRQFACQSRTDKHGQMVAKMVVEIAKQQPAECKFVLEVPAKRAHLAADIKLASGKLSSVAIQTPRFASKGEFAFETIARSAPHYLPAFLRPIAGQNLRFKSDLKDLATKEAYWLESALNVADWNKRASFLRLDSPVYRTDVEFEPAQASAKIGAFARSKRSAAAYQAPYSLKESAIGQLMDLAQEAMHQPGNKLQVPANKLWVLRSVIAAPGAMESVKQQARRALFEFADRKQSQRHSIEYSPADERVNFSFQHEPAAEAARAFQPRRMSAALSTAWARPSSMALESEWMDVDAQVAPFDGEQSFAKISALSRHRRSPFKSHESEFRYKKDEGYKAWMKHQDSKDKRHALRMEAAAEPKKWAKLAYEADKHGKTSWEHKWRQHAEKRAADQQEVYANQIQFERVQPDGQLAHRTSFDWQEPTSMVARMQKEQKEQRRPRRSTVYGGRYSPVEYLKHTSARLNSQTGYPTAGTPSNLYKSIDFDYQPSLSSARLNVVMPDDMVHASAVDFKPSERAYKLQSKLYDQRTKQPVYELDYATKPAAVEGLATGSQEPVFVNSQHPMLERPITSSLVANLFKQPMKLDYSDKYGRLASIDYDHSPAVAMTSSGPIYAGLRQKRAALYYKDAAADFEHQSSVDFYPETRGFFGKMKPAFERQPGDLVYKTSTKYGPVVVRVDSDRDSLDMELQSPVFNGKLVAEQQQQARVQLIKFFLDNKSQKVELAKVLRKSPIEWVRNSELAKRVARKIDSGRFEHETELLVSLVEAIFKLKSANLVDGRPVLAIEAELNKQQEKLVAKINGERVYGQLVADLVTKSADLALDVDNKRTLEHVTRLSRTSDDSYTLTSMTSHKSKPVFKLQGKIAAMVFEEPAHLFESRRGRSSSGKAMFDAKHVSTFEAVVYEPEEYHVAGQYDCLNKEARLVFKGRDSNKVQETLIKFDEHTDDIYVDSRLAGPHGQIYAAKAKINVDSRRCHHAAANYSAKQQSACKSELVYQEGQSGKLWAAEYVPNEYVAISSPRGKQTFQLSAY